MKVFISIYLISAFLLGCSKEPTNDEVVNPDSTALKLIDFYSTDVPEPSGLAYNKKSNSLFTVSDANSTIYEIDFTGRIIHSFTVSNNDLEGIAISLNSDTLYVVDEANTTIGKYSFNGELLTSFQVYVQSNFNNSLEGITIDNFNHLFVVNEKDPRLLIELDDGKEIFRRELFYTLDCSDIFYDVSTNCFWLISDESKKVLKLSKSGELIETYSIPFGKGEGIAVVDDKIYIINDEDSKLYVFLKP